MVTADGGSTVTSCGVCWSTSQPPSTSTSKTSDWKGRDSFTSSLAGLSPGTTYYLMAYAINSVGTGYSSQLTFTTLALAPVLTTSDLSAVTSTSATTGGNITNDRGSAVTARGVCWSVNQSPTVKDSLTTDGTGSGTFTSSVSKLTPGKTYYFRAYATNGIGTSYGNQVTTTTTALLPKLSTTSASSITATTAISGGNITNDGGSSVTARGVCWGTTNGPNITGNKTSDNVGTGSFTSSLTGLTAGATYYVRAYATNTAGTGYGNEVSFSAVQTSGYNCGTVTDIDGNLYHTVTIGTQCWMVENLKTTKYRNGDPIANISDNIVWTTLTSGAYCWYNNDPATYNADYGVLYNFYAVNDNRNIAPVGWHIPTDSEWTTLETFLGGSFYAGGALKEAGSSHWLDHNLWSDNSSGFSALPGGTRTYSNGSFMSIGYYGFLWSSSVDPNSNTSARSLQLTYSNHEVASWYSGWQGGSSVRCLKGESAISIPSISTIIATNISSISAISGGLISSNGGADVTAKGVCWGTVSNPTIANSKTSDGTGSGSFTSSLTGLTAGTTYYVRAYATNSQGTAYGSQVTFIAQNFVGVAPVVDFTASLNSVIIGQSVQFADNSTNAPTSWIWDFGDGATSTEKSPAHSYSSIGNYTVSLKATNNYGSATKTSTNYITVTQTSNSGIIFNPNLTYGTMSDNDGNTYKTIQIGTQTWMAENLKTTKYRNGEQIELVTDNAAWYNFTVSNSPKGAYRWYVDNATAYKATYGALYNWWAVADSRKLAPAGWHIPTDQEWTKLITFLGGNSLAGGTLKETGFNHWLSPNTGATNSSGFTALPSGSAPYTGGFYHFGGRAYFWSSTGYSDYLAVIITLYYIHTGLDQFNMESWSGFSVRCVRD